MTNGSVTTCSGTFFDAGGSGSQYGNNENFTFTICPSTPGQFISLEFDYLRLRSGDILRVYEGNTTTTLITSANGVNTNTNFTITSTDPTGCLTFVFTSNGSQTRDGWDAAISCVTQTINMSNGVTDSYCSGLFADPGGGTGNYSNNSNITYTLCPDAPGQAVQITFTSFNVEANFDFLTIYDGNTTTNSLGTYSNANSPNGNTFTSTDGSGCLTFVFNSDNSVTGAGWTADISCVSNEVVIADGSTEAKCGGLFTDSGGLTGNYSNSENITFTLCPSIAGKLVSVDFTSFAVHPSDDLEIYDGMGTTNLLGVYNNSNSANGQTFTSSDPSGCLTFRFVSDGSTPSGGWTADISCVNPPGVITDGLTENLCSGSFWDSGAGANYSNNENLTYTICPSTPGTFVDVEFLSFDVQANQDFLSIYDGPNTGSPLINTFSNANFPAGLEIRSTDPSGCLTFVFTSNGAVTGSGWQTSVNCYLPCQSILSSLVSTAPLEDAMTNEIRVCQSGTVDFVGAGVYTQNGTFYTQSDAQSTFEWDFGDGTILSGLGLTSVSHTYTDGEGYIVQLRITDQNACSNANDLDLQVAVSTTPLFSGALSSDYDLCLGESANLTGVVSPVTFTFDCAPASVDSLILPDGVGTSYTSTTTLTCYSPGQTLTNVSEINGICINIEHSWANDLDVTLVCPTGQSVILDSYGGVGNETFLGEPVDGDEASPVPGIGWDYCWSPTPTYGTWNAEAPGNDTLPPGSYASENTLGTLVGCELNGTWSLVITDNLAEDNGFIFSFDVDLNTPAPVPWTYTPSVVSTGWNGPATINNPGSNPISVTPSAAGSLDYIYTITDDFGCDYDTTITLAVTAPADPGTNTNSSLCTNGALIDLFDELGGTPDMGGTWSGPSVLANGDQGTFDPTTMNAGIYTYTVVGTGPCPDESATVTVTMNPPPSADAGAASDAFCGASTYTATAAAASFASLQWTGSGDGSFTDDTVEDAVYTPGPGDIASGTVTLTLTVYGIGACTDATDNIVLTVLPDTDGDSICNDVDLDDDNDGIPDLDEVPGDPLADTDSDGVPAYLDDDDTNGVIGNVDGLVQPAFDTDADNVPNHFDLDSDNDGIFDLIESGSGVTDADLNGVIDGVPADFGANGLYDTLETVPDSGVLNYVIADTDSDGNIDAHELDSDNDGCFDVIEAGYSDPDGNGLLGVGN